MKLALAVLLGVVAMTYAQGGVRVVEDAVNVANINFDQVDPAFYMPSVNPDAGAQLINKEPEFVNQEYNGKLYDNPYLRGGKKA